MKQNITSEEFITKLKSAEEFYDEIFNFGKNDIIFPVELLYNIRFSNCSFTGQVLKIEHINQPDKGLYFLECTFKCQVEIFNCNLDMLWFEETLEIEKLSLKSFKNFQSKIKDFNFSYDLKNKNVPILNTIFDFRGGEFSDVFRFENVYMGKGEFNFHNNTLGSSNNDDGFKKVSFRQSNIHNVLFQDNKFLCETTFFQSKFKYDSEKLKSKRFKSTTFYNNHFEKTEFSSAMFNRICVFHRCNFNGTISFRNLRNDCETSLKIYYCNFNEDADFERLQISFLDIFVTTFADICSFQSAKLSVINLDKTIFEKAAFFDEIKIDSLNFCNRKSIRTIKQQLQKTENKIDYNRFRAYELSAYYQELGWGWKRGFKDKFILGATKLSTGFDHSWRRALIFTVLSGVFWFSVLYFIEFYVALNLNNDNQSFTSGLFRFFLVTDFYSPFMERQYLNNGFSWIVFFLGKIFIAFGIYEMIQAFRKFKA
ncbi:hypothetical protein FMM05_16800 [Flavobacterium zepuense]|uniref:Pentapeptide repeat-containing protein n=1 Tax=Flavobacterium zepuense TaxID=2593302 RepID=A0A552UWF7_9FLAO|nr:hypothetical protein [Flavobacterium zepuense]TRW22539.1 hypothetical protein FMM05_16800 [Flavobacterium zepuense]